jgi:hypothetical protein
MNVFDDPRVRVAQFGGSQRELQAELTTGGVVAVLARGGRYVLAPVTSDALGDSRFASWDGTPTRISLDFDSEEAALEEALR